VIGIIDSCSDVISFTNRTSNKDSKRREITLIDENTSISITLWDEQVKKAFELILTEKLSLEFSGRKF
jgi:hypothetical protein